MNPLNIIPGFGNSNSDGADEQYEPHDRGVPDIGRFHRDQIAPSGITERETQAKVGEHYTRTFFINGWPDEPQDSFLEDLYLSPSVQNDVSIHISPYKPEKAIDELESALQKAEQRIGGGGQFVSVRSKQRTFEETQEVYNALTEMDVNLFDVGMYVTVRGESQEELEEAVEQVGRLMRTAPALTKPEVAKYRQVDAMKATSPIGDDEIGYRTEMLGGAIGAMFPFSSTSVVEPGGVEFGAHAQNRSPVIIDRFDRTNGYNQLTIGKIGSGKSFSTKLNILRTYASRDDVLLFMLDPLQGFSGITKALQGKHITIGGKVGLNPMHIEETPEEVLRRVPDLDPYAMKKKNLMDMFEMYFDMRGMELGDARGVLENAIEETYNEFDITRNIETHSKESPTVSDLIDTLRDMTENPSEYSETDSGEYVELVESEAARLVNGFRQFQQGGEYENLAGKSDINIKDEDVVYFDLSQYEGSGDVGLMMHLLLSKVYERAKETDKKVMFAVDEAHYIMKDAKSLDFLTQVIRHSRHYDLSINFVTQTIEEFFSHEQSETIAQQCSVKQFHKIESGLTDHIINTLDLTDSEAEFIRNAQPGDEELGYSEALIGVDEYGYLPTRIYASEFEEAVVTHEPDEVASDQDDIEDITEDATTVDSPARTPDDTAPGPIDPAEEAKETQEAPDDIDIDESAAKDSDDQADADDE